MKVRYFAWVRERVGKTEEDIDPPAGVATIGDLVSSNVVRSVIDKRHVRPDARIAGASETAFFPPMTGV